MTRKMIKYTTLLLGAFLFMGTNAFGFMQCGPGGEVVGSGSGTVEKLSKAGINWFFSSPTYTAATTSSTSGCDGFLAFLEAEKEIFVAGSYDYLREEASQGIGGKETHIGTLASLHGCQDGTLLAAAMQDQYQDLFHEAALEPNDSKQFLNDISALIKNNPSLEESCVFSSSAS